MDIGESISETIVREVREKTGLDVQPTCVVGVYTDPHHVFAYDDGEVRQEFSICLACKIVGGQLKPSDESLEVAFFAPNDISDLAMHDSIRKRIRHFLERRAQAVIA
jgi:ADP-ribose pyrophosphatase YjhB (NUDIX family)